MTVLLSAPLMDTRTGTDVPLGSPLGTWNFVLTTPVEPGVAVDVAVGFKSPTERTTESATAGGGLGGKNPSNTGDW